MEPDVVLDNLSGVEDGPASGAEQSVRPSLWLGLKIEIHATTGDGLIAPPEPLEADRETSTMNFLYCTASSFCVRQMHTNAYLSTTRVRFKRLDTGAGQPGCAIDKTSGRKPIQPRLLASSHPLPASARSLMMIRAFPAARQRSTHHCPTKTCLMETQPLSQLGNVAATLGTAPLSRVNWPSAFAPRWLFASDAWERA